MRKAFIVGMSLAVLASAGPSWGDDQASSSATGDQQIAEWIADLDAASFAAREQATRRLVEAGAPAIVPLAAIDESASLEQILRTISILSTLAAEGIPATRAAAGAALEKLSHASDVRLARRAGETYQAYALGQQLTAIAKIELLGGRVERLDDNPIGQAVAVYFGRSWRGGESEIDLLKTLPSIEAVSFERSGLTDSALSRLAQLPQLKRLYLDNSHVTGAGLDQLKPLAELKFLSLRGLTLDKRRALDGLSQLSRLESLRLDNTNVADEDLKRLAPLTRLSTLFLNGTQTSDAGLVYLKPVASLKWLELASTRVTGKGLVELRRLPNLQFLTLENSPVDNDGLVQVAQLAQLTKLGLDGTHVDDAGIAHLARLKKLETLWLNHTRLTDAGLEHLAGLTNLVTLHIEQTHVTLAGVEKLEQALPRLRVSEKRLLTSE